MNTSRCIIALILLAACTVVSMAGSIPAPIAGKLEPQPQRFRWKDRVIKISISTSLRKPNGNMKVDSDVNGAIRRSLQAWQDVADVEFQISSVDRENVSPAGTLGDGVSLITIAPTAENVLFMTSDAQAASAKTRLFYDRKGFVTEADVVLSPFQQFSTDGSFGTFDLQSALTHEIGHLLGLRHSGVLGAVMSDKLAKIGALGFPDLGPRVLADSDIASIHDLYGARNSGVECCATVTGRLSVPLGKSAKVLRVWAEDDVTGRVAAQADVSADGTFRLGGLPPGAHNIYWKTKSASNGSSTGELGIVQAETGETKILNQKISLVPTALALDFLGVNGQLAESGISIETGRETLVYLGGKGLDSKNVIIEISSPFLHVIPLSAANQDFGDSVSVMSLVVSVDSDTPPGVYSIFAKTQDGSKASLIGALKVE